MSNFFNPGSAKFRRGVFLTSVYACTVVAAHVIMGDFGTQKHVFTPIQSYVTSKIDSFYGITAEELNRLPGEKVDDGNPQQKPFISMKIVEVNKGDKSK